MKIPVSAWGLVLLALHVGVPFVWSTLISARDKAECHVKSLTLRQLPDLEMSLHIVCSKHAELIWKVLSHVTTLCNLE